MSFFRSRRKVVGPDFYDIRIYDSIHGYNNLFPYMVKCEFGVNLF